MSDHSAGTPCHCLRERGVRAPAAGPRGVARETRGGGRAEVLAQPGAAAETPEFQQWLHKEFPTGAPASGLTSKAAASF